jgi:ABC-type spermidine/putrescine transport system permease subunit I
MDREATVSASTRIVPALTARRSLETHLVNLFLLLPCLLLLVGVLGVPLLFIALTSLEPNVLVPFKGPALDNYHYLAARAYYRLVVWRTLELSATCTVISVVAGYGAAMMLRELSGRLGNLAAMGLTFPILTGPLVVVLGWMALLPDGGPIFSPLIKAGLIDPPRLLGSQTAVMIGIVHFTLPFAVLTLYTALKQIHPHYYEAATSLGAGAFRSFAHVTLPLSLPGVLSASIITFSLAASSYISPHYLGGAAELTLTTLIAQFVLATYNTPLASAAATILLALMIVVITLLTKVFGWLTR